LTLKTMDLLFQTIES